MCVYSSSLPVIGRAPYTIQLLICICHFPRTLLDPLQSLPSPPLPRRVGSTGRLQMRRRLQYIRSLCQPQVMGRVVMRARVSVCEWVAGGRMHECMRVSVLRI
jgi:hypothetical protein